LEQFSAKPNTDIARWDCVAFFFAVFLCLLQVMGKAKGLKNNGNTNPSSSISKVSTVIELKADPILLYKIRVLLYDLCHISSDRSSEQRTLCTTDELYISGPYFTASEAERIKAATVNLDPGVHDCNKLIRPSHANVDCVNANLLGSSSVAEPGVVRSNTYTVEEAIKFRLSGFLDKRKASGDSRPCGPHDLGPIYREVFGISQAELQDEKFLSRLRRPGLGDSGLEKVDEKETKKGGKKNR
jgi:hypothetical protein